tara:strand:+ start:349 stop:897 length:549 start_codon:yes stop_codon:yes gene_type:complete
MKVTTVSKTLRILKLQLVVWLLIFGIYLACRTGLELWDGSELGIIDFVIGPELILVAFLSSKHNILPSKNWEVFCHICLFSIVLGVTYGFDNFSLRKEAAYRNLGPTMCGRPTIWREECLEYLPKYCFQSHCRTMELQLVTRYGQLGRCYLTSELRKMDSQKLIEVLGEGNKILELREIYGE